MRVGMMLAVAFAAVAGMAMPTAREIQAAQPVVADAMKTTMAAVNAKTKTPAEAAEISVKFVESAESEAAKYLLLRGAALLYARGGEYDRAVETVETLRETVADVPLETVAEILSAAVAGVAEEKAPRLHAEYRKVRRVTDARKAAAELQAQLRKKPTDPVLRGRYAEALALSGDWPGALDQYARLDAKYARLAAFERTGEAMEGADALAAADFWWERDASDPEPFRAHAVEWYRKALEQEGLVTGLRRAAVANLIAEFEKPPQPRAVAGKSAPVAKTSKADAATSALYCVIDLSAGPNAERYPVSYLAKPPEGGFNTDEYKTTKLVLRRIEAGSFIMGDNQTDEAQRMTPSHRVTLTKPFHIGIFEVTQSQYALVTGNDPSQFKGDMRPVEHVSYGMIRGNGEGTKWPGSPAVDTYSFMGKLRAKAGLAFDLPTEAQWEYACRAGTTSAFNNGGDTEEDLKKLGRFKGNEQGRGTTVVGSYEPNAWGLYDMHGNVWEHCLDWYGDYPLGNAKDPVGPSGGDERVHRGGAWDQPYARGCRSATRSKAGSSHGWRTLGFRVALTCDGKGEPISKVPVKTETVVPSRKQAKIGDDPDTSAESAVPSWIRKSALYCVVDLSAGPNAERYPVSYLAKLPDGGFNKGEYKTTKLVLRRIEPGTFIMGENQADKSHSVTLTKPFFIGIFEVTQKQYALVTGNDPSQYKGDMRPVERVSYDMIRGNGYGAGWPGSPAVDNYSFMGKLRARTGLAFDLPTEAQWEYACRAGTKSDYNNGGKTEASLKKLGRFLFNQQERGYREKDVNFVRHRPDGKGGFWGNHTAVGSYEPNAWGLYDMHGNVWEWCLDLDWNGRFMYGTDPKGHSSGTFRMIRGGGWSDSADGCNSVCRLGYPSNDRGDSKGLCNIGFRVALVPDS
ncbi:MAG: SUMF1/EgtB/PvdO family nonheme iron enzyme [Kiritimatiellae bacterium]|nr:SUMF1/EgtB/PvdO family nonheme iron enzyme [Kiritimatiellia bacterium]